MYKRRLDTKMPKRAKKPKKGEPGYTKQYGDFDWEDNMPETSKSRAKPAAVEIEGLGGRVL